MHEERVKKVTSNEAVLLVKVRDFGDPVLAELYVETYNLLHEELFSVAGGRLRKSSPIVERLESLEDRLRTISSKTMLRKIGLVTVRTRISWRPIFWSVLGNDSFSAALKIFEEFRLEDEDFTGDALLNDFTLTAIIENSGKEHRKIFLHSLLILSLEAMIAFNAASILGLGEVKVSLSTAREDYYRLSHTNNEFSRRFEKDLLLKEDVLKFLHGAEKWLMKEGLKLLNEGVAPTANSETKAPSSPPLAQKPAKRSRLLWELLGPPLTVEP